MAQQPSPSLAAQFLGSLMSPSGQPGAGTGQEKRLVIQQVENGYMLVPTVGMAPDVSGLMVCTDPAGVGRLAMAWAQRVQAAKDRETALAPGGGAEDKHGEVTAVTRHNGTGDVSVRHPNGEVSLFQFHQLGDAVPLPWEGARAVVSHRAGMPELVWRSREGSVLSLYASRYDTSDYRNKA